MKFLPPLSPVTLPPLSISNSTSVNLSGANAYYRAPYESGAAYLLIMDDSYPKNTEPSLARVASVFPQAISNLGIANHKLALIGHLEYYGLEPLKDGNSITVNENCEAVLLATFDDIDRLTKLDVRINARAQAMPGAR